MNNNDPYSFVIPTYTTSGLTTKVEAIRALLAATPAARDTNAAKHLSKLAEVLRQLGL